MIKRYEDPTIATAWSLGEKYRRWQDTELAVIGARAQLGRIPPELAAAIKTELEEHRIDGDFILEKEKVLHHDLNAFLEERMRYLSRHSQALLHKGMTSYDTEEPGFVLTLKASCDFILHYAVKLGEELEKLALKYRYTPMIERTHGQEAEIQSLGKRCLSWHQDLVAARLALESSMETLKFSKLSGAIGTNNGIDAELETAALKILGLVPWTGATQIMPRGLYAPIACALATIASTVEKIAVDVRLGARSGRPLYHEPFGKMQKGSSAMPHKKNTIICENTSGMARIARAALVGIMENIVTWEARAIEQSSVERVLWPDLFHATARALNNMTKVMSGLVVYPHNMLIEIAESHGCYASNAAKEFLTEFGEQFGLSREHAYRAVQLAAFMAFEANRHQQSLIDSPPSSLEQADQEVQIAIAAGGGLFKDLPSIRSIIFNGNLKPSLQLDSTAEEVAGFNAKLRQIFNSDPHQGRDRTEVAKKWLAIFDPSHYLANEAHLFSKAFPCKN